METDANGRLVFPSDRAELEAMKEGRRRDALVPIPPGRFPKIGDVVTFAQASTESSL